MEIYRQNLDIFINEEKSFFNGVNSQIDWEDERWDTRHWLFHRGNDCTIVFTYPNHMLKKALKESFVLKEVPVFPIFSDFMKAVAVYTQRTKSAGFMAIRNYVNECRRLYVTLSQHSEPSPVHLTRWHFEETVRFLQAINYKNIYDATANLQIIGTILDKKCICSRPIQFVNPFTPFRSKHAYKPISDLIGDDLRIEEEKLPSYEAMKAYAICTNEPIDDHEEILLRTIDLLIAMGQRGNEITLIPYDCWVERPIKGKLGESVIDAYGEEIKEVGIRYYAEKHFQSRVHWLAKQDIPFATRAVTRLKELTTKARAVAKWQEENPGRVWDFDPNYLIEDRHLISMLSFRNAQNLYLYLNNNRVAPASVDKTVRNSFPGRKDTPMRIYRAGDIESYLKTKLSDHIALKEKVNGKWRVILKTSEVLSIRFEGAFRFKRIDNVLKVFPGRTVLKDINGALGAFPKVESIFERRNLTEADGSKIILTSHQPRHWRNTLYELAGMSNVQQALAMGRQKLTQNKTYQHTTISEQTQLHKDYLSFNSPAEKISFLHDGIRTNKIMGDLTAVYNSLKDKEGVETAEVFLKTHSQALHITPYGGCTHDFSQNPCVKHLQCWNGCSNLHRTSAPDETENLKTLLQNTIASLEKMKGELGNEYGSDVWVQDLEKKVQHLRRGIEMKIDSTPVQVFPNGTPVTLPLSMRKRSSVKGQ